MKILFYTHFYYPETGAASLRMQYFVKVLRRGGHDIKIVVPAPNYPKGKVFQGYKKFMKDEENNITYLPLFLAEKDTPISRFFSYLSYFIVSFFYNSFNNYKPDLVINSGPPIFTSLVAVIFSKIRRAKFIWDVRDIWPDIGIELGILNNKFIIETLRKIEKFILNNSDAITVTAKGDKDNIITKGMPGDKISVIYNGADTDIFKPLNSEETRKVKKEFGLTLEKKILVYFGSFNFGMNDIDLLGNSLLELKNIRDDFQFVAIGDGNKKEELLAKLETKVDYVHFESLEISRVAKIIAASDASLIPRKRMLHDTGGNIPIKCFESWAAGIPVVLSTISNTEIERIFNECSAGEITNSFEPEDYANLINKLLERDDYNKLSENSYKFVQQNFDRIKQAEKLNKIIDNLK